MMLRAFVALLLAANLGFFAWTQGWLDSVVGVRAIGDREPERVLRQVHPEAVRVLTPQAVQDAASAAEARLTCLEAGPFAADVATKLQAELVRTMPMLSFVNQKSETPGVYLVYMGPYPQPDVQQRKRDELSRIKLAFEEIDAPIALAHGFSLGRFDDRPAAEAALAQFSKRGVRSARVAELTPPGAVYRLRAERVDVDTAGKLFALRSEALVDGGFNACASR